MNKMTSLNLLCDVMLGNHVTRSRISVFHADLPAIQQSLDLHAVPHAGLTLIQCQYLLHHIIAGACADHVVDVICLHDQIILPAVRSARISSQLQICRKPVSVLFSMQTTSKS
jgi:hypothetical protein